MSNRDCDAPIIALFERESARILRIVASRWGIQRAEDACQTAWTEAYKTRSFDPAAPNAMWYIVKAAMRAGDPKGEGETLSSEWLLDVAASDDVVDTVIDRETLALIEELPDNQRIALTATAILGLSYEQAAHVLNTTVTWVNRHTTEGRAALRKLRGED